MTEPSQQHQWVRLPLLKSKAAIDAKPTIYVCVSRVCKLPTSNLRKAMEQAQEYKRFELRKP